MMEEVLATARYNHKIDPVLGRDPAVRVMLHLDVLEADETCATLERPPTVPASPRHRATLEPGASVRLVAGNRGTEAAHLVLMRLDADGAVAWLNLPGTEEPLPPGSTRVLGCFGVEPPYGLEVFQLFGALIPTVFSRYLYS